MPLGRWISNGHWNVNEEYLTPGILDFVLFYYALRVTNITLTHTHTHTHTQKQNKK